ncbi:hypothetical protein Avbf_15881 [Armadillidium vulgare]|nr:hypothetical protein Avbf_15881 [Armadillidium vulgare]
MCRTNKLLMYIGYYLFLSKAEEKSEEKEKSQIDKKDIMEKMRLLCRLYLQFKSEIQKDVSLQEMFDSSYMTEFKRAVMKTLKNYKTSRHILGFLILKTLSILESRLSVLKREDESKKMVEFRKALNNNLIWTPLFGKQRKYRASRSQFQIKKPTNLPREEDMRKVRLFLLNGIKKFSSEDEFDPRNFTILRRLLVTRITFLNARRGGEPCRLLISQWEEAKQDQWLNQDFVKAALNTKMEDLSLLNEFKIAYQKGKGLQSLSIIIPNSCIKGLNIMSDSRVRRRAGIREDNKYLFPTTGFNSYHVQGVSDISTVIKESGVERLFKAKDIRHYVSTKQAMLTLPPEVRSLFYLQMGHEETINKNIYQSPLVIESLMKVGKILKILDESLISSDAISTKNIDVKPTEKENHTFESNSNSNFKVSENSTYMNNSEEMLADDNDDPDGCVDEKNEKIETLKTSGRNVWTPLKRKRIMDEPLFKRYFMDLSPEGAKGKIPPKKHISIFLDKNKEIFNDKDEESRIKLVRSKNNSA